MDRSQQFRQAAKDYNCDACKGSPYHYFDLSGGLYSAAAASSVKGLVEMARRFSLAGSRGLHTELLELAAKRDELAQFVAGTKPVINWHRPDHVQAEREESPEGWITLAGWLTEQDQEPVLDLALQFALAARAAGLTYGPDEVPKDDPSGFWHQFVLRFGRDMRLTVYAKPEAEQLKALIELARVYSELPRAFGPHLTLLAMVADPADLEAFAAGRIQFVGWVIPSLRTPLGRTTLREWLAAQGQIFSEEYDGLFGSFGSAFAHEFVPRQPVEPTKRMGIYSPSSPFDLGHLDQSRSIGDHRYGHERPLAIESALAELLRDGSLECPYEGKLLTIPEQPDEEALLLKPILGGGAMANLDLSKLALVTTDGEAVTPPLSADDDAVEEAVAALTDEGREAEALTSVLALAESEKEIGTPRLTYFSVGGRLNGK